MLCPKCQSDQIEQTNDFDMSPDECTLHFDCEDCECTFKVVYLPTESEVVQNAKLLDE